MKFKKNYKMTSLNILKNKNPYLIYMKMNNNNQMMI